VSPGWSLFVSIATAALGAVSVIVVGFLTWHAARQASSRTAEVAQKTGELNAEIAKEANDIRRFEAIVKALEARVDDLEKTLAKIEQALVTEQAAHRQTHELLRLALRYIRELVTWARTDQRVPMPPAPADLEADL